MKTLPYIVATAGHVDHGKSALVRALTGTDPDRLPEEKARGITIDLGFASLRLPSPADAPEPAAYQVGIVDVPGHEDFVKNMVAGIGSVDLALLVVAADDGWKPQTEEHLQILCYLRVRAGVVALTKVDLAASPAAAADAADAVRRQLEGSPLADAPIVGTSVVTGAGLEELKATLARVLSRTPPPRDAGKPRLPVDRAFALKGVGTVVTGTLTGGRLHRGQAVVLQPAGRPCRVRGVQSHGRDCESCPPGSRVALNLPDLAVDAGHAATSEAAVGRGDVIVADAGGRAGTRGSAGPGGHLGTDPGAADTLDVLLERSARPAGARADALTGALSSAPGFGGGREGAAFAPRLADGLTVHVHHGSGDFLAKVMLLGAAELPPGGRALAQLRLESPAYAFVGDAFIVRDGQARHTLAGGVVLDPAATRRGFRAAARRDYLAPLAEALRSGGPPRDLSPEPFVLALLGRDGAAPRRGLLARSFFADAEVAEAARRLVEGGKAVAAGDMLLDSARWANLRRKAAEAVAAEHRARPESPGLKLADLQAALATALPAGAPSTVFDALVSELCREGFARAGAVLRSADHRPALPPHLQAAGARLRAMLAAKPFEPPSRKELAREPAADKALRFLLQTGEAVAIGEEVVLSADALRQATEIARRYITGHGPATASELRQALGTTRRVLMPLVEYWDAHGLTVRRGDVRLLRAVAPGGNTPRMNTDEHG